MLCLDLDLPFQRPINGTLLLGEAGKDNMKEDRDFLQRSLTLPQLENVVTMMSHQKTLNKESIENALVFVNSMVFCNVPAIDGPIIV